MILFPCKSTNVDLQGNMIFTGREEELSQLRLLKRKKAASLVVISGRRRIGKSALAEKFGEEFKDFFEFQGLAPRKDISNVAQLENFASQFREQFKLPQLSFKDWTEAFTHLAKQVERKKVLVLLDEISWMGSGDPDFPGRLKIAWDTQFKNNPNLVMILCGSVSSWIEENILKDYGFVGRVSLVLRLGELELHSCGKFWGERAQRISNLDKLKLLCITGGVPKYLEELQPTLSADENISRLCFRAGGYLFEDFQRIFSDIFGRKTDSYRQILKCLIERKLPASQIAKLLKAEQSGELSRSLADLELSGFIARDFSFKPDGSQSKISKYRISDNYLRFYLKYIEPNEQKIKKGSFRFSSLHSLINWPTILGLQFENLILNRVPELLDKLSLTNEQVISASAYFQTKTVRTESCQVDLLISCKSRTFYLCELKFRDIIDRKVIKEVEQKISRLKFPKHSSIRPVLIYAGNLAEEVHEADFFDRIVDVTKLIN